MRDPDRYSAEPLKSLLEKRGIKPAVLARRAGLSATIMSSYLGERESEPGLVNAYKIAQALGVQIESLITGEVARPAIECWEVPLLGDVPAGPLNEAYENREDTLFIPKWMMPGRANFFAVKVYGDSMEPTIADRAIAVFREIEEVNRGDIGVFRYRGEATIKRYYTDKFGHALVAANPKYAPILISATGEEDFEVRGRLELVINTFHAPRVGGAGARAK